MNTPNAKTALLILLMPLFSFSQKIENIRFEQQGKMINIYYDLSGKGSYDVSIYCNTGENAWGNPLKQVTGAIGYGQTAGTNKTISWDVLAEREKLTGEISFKVEARNNELEGMVFVKGGTFTMGSTSWIYSSDVRPSHKVSLSDFYIGKYEVTQKQWIEIMGNNPSRNKRCDNCPVESVSWNKVQKFVKKLNAKTGQHYRLPTDAEWEYAARGGNQSKGYEYAGSNNIDEVAWYSENSGKKTHPVGIKQANELGIYGMSGNVWEWCGDWYDDGYYSISPKNNPQGASSGSGRVLRGGFWHNNAYHCKVAARSYISPGNSHNNLGFRLVFVP